jgi:UDP-N-acetyl-D-glucosamine dehydrogenase
MTAAASPAVSAATRPLRVAVLGQGYVGLPLAMKAVAAGHDVVGIDAATERVKRLAAGDSFVEDVPRVALEAALRAGRYAVTDDALACEGFEVAVVTVPTPLHEGAPDLSYIESAARMLAPHVRPGCLVVLESTTYPGTTEQLFVPILEAGSDLVAGVDFSVGYSPERIDPGNRTWDLGSTPKLVSGIDAESLDRTDAFYSTFVRTTVRVSTCRAAEMAKLLENTFRHVNVALVNELAMFAHDLDIDVWEAIDAAATKPFGFMKFTPGPGVGGHCLPIDPSYLSWTVRQRLGRSFRFVELANDINDHMPDYVASRLMRALNKQGVALSRAKVLVLGLAYKRNAGDARESPAVALIHRLVADGAEVAVADPHVVEAMPTDRLTRRVSLSRAELERADAVVLVTDHDGFDYDLVTTHAALVLDTRHRLDGPNVEQL